MMQQDVKSQLTTKEQTQTLMRLIRYTFPFKKLIFLTLAMLTFSTMQVCLFLILSKCSLTSI